MQTPVDLREIRDYPESRTTRHLTWNRCRKASDRLLPREAVLEYLEDLRHREADETAYLQKEPANHRRLHESVKTIRASRNLEQRELQSYAWLHATP
ncbi:MAG: hypothetical protein JXR29_06140 [Methylothermaceae bacterium]|nr:hypothetical protein [Methylothermaceae bacterium]